MYGELRRSLAMIYAPQMLDVKNIFAVLCVSLLALQPLQPLINYKFLKDFCCFSYQKVLFSVINDAMASSPQGGAVIDS